MWIGCASGHGGGLLIDGWEKRESAEADTDLRHRYPRVAQLRIWLLSEGCSHVAMESTGVYWKPVYAILEGPFQIVVANAQHVKKVPGRKTDVKDAEWIADLLCHGLLRSSFVPPKPIRELRDLTRYRRKLVEAQAGERNRLLKLLESANIKLASVATRRTPPFSFEITTGSTRESRKRYSVSRATTPREAQALCRPTGSIGRDPWRGLDFGCSHHCRTGR